MKSPLIFCAWIYLPWVIWLTISATPKQKEAIFGGDGWETQLPALLVAALIMDAATYCIIKAVSYAWGLA